MNKKIFLMMMIGLSLIVSLILVFFALSISTQNKAISLEEQIGESKSSINIQEKRRVDLIMNLVDTAQEYDKHEKETFQLLAEARSQASSGDVEKANLAINAVAESYPELKSQENYKTLMQELSTTENLITEHRNNFNIQVRAYNKHVKKFPSRFFLEFSGYDVMKVDYLEYVAPVDAPTNLFDKGD